MIGCSITDSTTNEPNVEAITTLASLAILSQDDELLTAALTEVTALSQDKRGQLDPENDIDRLLVAHHLLQVRVPFHPVQKEITLTHSERHAQNEADEAVSILTQALHRQPYSTTIRKQLATLLLQTQQPKAALALLSDARQNTSGSEVEEDAESLRLRSVALSRLDPAEILQDTAAEEGEQTRMESSWQIATRAVHLAPWEVSNWRMLAASR